MAATSRTKTNGVATTEEVTRAVSKAADEPIGLEMPEERETRFQRTGFARMSLDWGQDDEMMMARIHRAVDKKVDEFFGDLIAMQFELLLLVRECETTVQGDIIPDEDGLPKWKRTGTGLYVEDWSRLTRKQRVDWIFKLQMNIIDWQKRATEAWAEAMFAKARWEDKFAIGFEELSNIKATVNDREARGKLVSRDERYFAIMVSYYSRMADGHVQNMKDLLLRMSQVHQAESGR